jgi:hypothetical protein
MIDQSILSGGKKEYRSSQTAPSCMTVAYGNTVSHAPEKCIVLERTYSTYTNRL